MTAPPSAILRAAPVGETPPAAARTGRSWTDALDVVTGADYDSLPEQEWLVGDMIPAGGLTVLYGKPGTGKSFLALDLAASVSLGRKFHAAPTLDGPTLYLLGEGHAGLKGRIAAWREHYAAPLLDRMHVARRPGSLMREADVSLLLELVDTIRPVLIVVDTLARLITPGNENEAADMSRFLDALGRVCQVANSTALVIHHQGRGKSTAARGSSVLDGAADAMLRVSGSVGAGVILSCEKQKEAEPFDRWAFAFDRVAGSLVPRGTRGVAPTGSMRARIESAVHALYCEEQAGPLSKTKVRDRVGINKQKCDNELDRLAADPTSTVETVSTRSGHPLFGCDCDR